MCEEESDDPEAVHKLLEINDSIHRTIERYKLVKKGDLDAASRIPKGTLGTTTGVSTNANNELSLIDFDPEEPSSNGNGNIAEASSHGGNALENDLLGLSLGDQGPVTGGGISLGGSNSKCSMTSKFTISHFISNAHLSGLPFDAFRTVSACCIPPACPAGARGIQAKLRYLCVPECVPTCFSVFHTRTEGIASGPNHSQPAAAGGSICIFDVC